MDPSHIMQVGMGFWASKALLSAVELDLFSVVGQGALTSSELADRLALSARAVPDFPTPWWPCVSWSARETGRVPPIRIPLTAHCSSTSVVLHTIGGILEMANERLYRFWGDLTPALRTGAPQNETKNGGDSMFATLYEIPDRLEQF